MVDMSHAGECPFEDASAPMYTAAPVQPFEFDIKYASSAEIEPKNANIEMFLSLRARGCLCVRMREAGGLKCAPTRGVQPV